MINRALKIVCLGIFVLALGIPSLAQNTKGDRPSPASRETRFKTPKKSKTKRPARRVRGDDKPQKRVGLPPAGSRAGERPGKPITPSFSKSRPQKTQRPWKGDIAGRRIRPRSSASRAKNVYPQPDVINYSSQNLQRNLRRNDNPNVKRVRRMQREEQAKPRVGKPIRPTFHSRRPQERQRAWRGDLTGRRIRSRPSGNLNPPVGNMPRMAGGTRPRGQRGGTVPPGIMGRARNIFTGKNYYINNQSLRVPRTQTPANRVALNMLKRYPGPQKPGVNGRKIRPRSASASYLARRSTNTWAHFAKPKRRQGAITTDLAGKKLRTKNFETKRPVLTNPTLNYQRRIAAGERPYQGPAAGGYISRTRMSQRAWKGDIAHYRVRGGRPPRHGERAFLGFLKGGGFSSATRPWKPGAPVRGRAPGVGARGVGKYQGNIKTGRRGFNDQGEEFTGNIRTGRRGFSDQGEEFSGNIKTGRRGFGDQGEEYTGNIKSRRLLKGGGSRSGSWNNRGMPLQGRTPGKAAYKVGGWQGNIKAGRRGFNDQGEEYPGNIRVGRRAFADQGEEYTGNIKFRRPAKGGGSRSGKLWNNNNSPILVKTPPSKAGRFAGYQGNIKAGKRAFNDQGEEFSGNIKARRPEKGGGSVSGKLWNNDERPVVARDYSSQSAKVTRYSGNLKAKRPEKGGGSISGQLWNNDERPIAGKMPKVKEGDKYTGTLKVSRNHYSRNPKSARGALEGERASSSAMKADQYSRGARRNWDYVKNPSSDDEAQRTREPGRAFYRSGDYQGNIKFQRFDLFGKRGLHPDAQFVKLNKNNVSEEKDVFTNFKLWWARLFKKNETQPDHLKEKGRTPRYDKGEAGMWYE